MVSFKSLLLLLLISLSHLISCSDNFSKDGPDHTCKSVSPDKDTSQEKKDETPDAEQNEKIDVDEFGLPSVDAGQSEEESDSDSLKLYEFSKEEYRGFLKQYWAHLGETDQQKGIPIPEAEKQYSQNAELIDLIPIDKITVGSVDLKKIIGQRRSRRSFTEESLSLEELSFLLWSTQGVSKEFRDGSGKLQAHYKTVPSAGARHPFETYLIINRVETIDPGVYRYLPFQHKLLFIKNEEYLDAKATDACYRQKFVGESAVIFFWTAIPYRTEWRYSFHAPKFIALDAGHVCQNLYLASEAIGGGTCAIGAYDQKKADTLIGVDGKDEFTVYIAPVGKIAPE